MRTAYDSDDDEEEDEDESLDLSIDDSVDHSVDEDPQHYDQRNVDADDYATMPCPYCGRAMSEFAEVCPHCKSYISREDVPAGRQPWWVLVATALLLAALAVGVVSFR